MTNISKLTYVKFASHKSFNSLTSLSGNNENVFYRVENAVALLM